MKLDRRGSIVLGEEACREHLAREAAASGIGRVAINAPQSPYTIPVNFTVVGGGILIRLGTGWAAYHLDGAAVTFETDQFAASRHEGWSVVVEGIARAIPYNEVARLGSNLPSPIVSVPGVRVFEIVPFKVSGRAVEPDIRGEQPDLAAWPSEDAGQPAANLLHVTRDSTEELFSAVRTAHWDLNAQIAETHDVAVRERLLERRRLLEDLAAQWTTGELT